MKSEVTLTSSLLYLGCGIEDLGFVIFGASGMPADFRFRVLRRDSLESFTEEEWMTVCRKI